MQPGLILELIGKKYNTEILRATAEPRSAQQLSDELDIPIATSYRRLDELAETQLLELDDRVLSDEHRRTSVYRRTVDEIRISFQDGDVSVVLEESEERNTLDDVWRTLSE